MKPQHTGDNIISNLLLLTLGILGLKFMTSTNHNVTKKILINTSMLAVSYMVLDTATNLSSLDNTEKHLLMQCLEETKNLLKENMEAS